MTILLCDPCYQGATGLMPECEDGCDAPLEHEGLCQPEPAHQGTRCAGSDCSDRSHLWETDTCAWCGQSDRLHEVPREPELIAKLPTVGEEDEGVWWLHWPKDEMGPFASAQDAWLAWYDYAQKVS